MKKNTFLFSTLLLIVANFISRVIGLVYRVLLSRKLGAEGIGIYQLSFHTYIMMIAITTSGIPVAISKLVASYNAVNDNRSSRRVLGIGLGCGITLSLILSATLYFKMDFFNDLISKEMDLSLILYTLIPALPVVTVSTMLRSYFYGLKKVTPSAIAQISEQLVRITYVFAMLTYIANVKLQYKVFVASLGILVGELAGLTVLLISLLLRSKNKRQSHPNNSYIDICGSLFVIALPITVTKLLSVAMQSTSMFLVPRQLVKAGLSMTEAVSIFGQVVGMTMPLLFIPFIVTSAFVVNLIPNISENKKLHQYRSINQQTSKAIRATILTALPISLLYYMYPREITMFLYGNNSAAIYLRYLSFASVFLSIYHILSGVLHGLGKQMITTTNYIIGMSFNLLGIWFLVKIPSINIMGFVISFIVSTLVMLSLNFYFTRKYVDLDIDGIQDILYPIIAGVIMLFAITYSKKVLLGLWDNNICFFIEVGLGMIAYLISIIALGCVRYGRIISIVKNK